MIVANFNAKLSRLTLLKNVLNIIYSKISSMIFKETIGCQIILVYISGNMEETG